MATILNIEITLIIDCQLNLIVYTAKCYGFRAF